MKTVEKRTWLNPRHKAVYLNKKGGDYLFFYCVRKGKEFKREFIKDSHTSEKRLRISFEINGYFAFVDLSVEDVNPKKSIEWKLEKLEDYVYNNFLSVKSWGISINNNF